MTHAPRQTDLFASTIEERFVAFHLAHPKVYHSIVRYARVLHRGGIHHCGIALIWERMRWDWLIEIGPKTDPYTLNNDFRAHYARLVMERCPDLKDFFEIRRRRSA